MGNYASVGDSYTKGESDGRYPLKTALDAAIENSNTGCSGDNRNQRVKFVP